MLRKITFLIACGFCIFGIYQYAAPMFQKSDVEIPRQITFQDKKYDCTDSYIQTDAPRPKPEFLPTGRSVQGEQYGDLDGGNVYQNPKTDAIYIQYSDSTSTKYVLYETNEGLTQAD